MGLLDSIIGSVLGSAQGQGGGLQSILASILSSQGGTGGLGGLLARMEQQGMGNVAQSWVGNGPNQSIDPQSLGQVFGQDKVDQWSQQTGMGQDQLLQHLSSILPQAVDHATPNGQVSDTSPFDEGGTELR